MTPLRSLDDLYNASFLLLGNNPSDLFFPSNIVAAEGPSDMIFLKSIYSKMLSVKMISKANIVFHYLEGIDKAATGLEGIVQMLKTQSYIPVYRGRICCLFEQKELMIMSNLNVLLSLGGLTKNIGA